MLNAILEARERKPDCHEVTLIMSGEEFYKVYDDLNDNNAREIIDNYLQYRGDDARAQFKTIYHDEDYDTINIVADFHYLGNDHTEMR